MGLITTIIYGVWFFRENDHVRDSNFHHFISEESGGTSLCLFIVGALTPKE
jgi:hypothetical protein